MTLPLHQRRHPSLNEPGCFGCKAATIQWAGQPSQQTAMERRWAVDMPAYKRLREQGLQPPHIDGCATLERDAHTRYEVETGQVIPDTRKLTDAINWFEDGTSRSVFTPADTPKAVA